MKIIDEEAERAESIYGPFSSTHEALGVLTEEFNELIEAIRSNKLWSVHREAVQVSAVAMRLVKTIDDTCDIDSRFWDRSTGGKPS